MAETLRLNKGKRLLILSDSQAAIAAVVRVGRGTEEKGNCGKW